MIVNSYLETFDYPLDQCWARARSKHDQNQEISRLIATFSNFESTSGFFYPYDIHNRGEFNTSRWSCDPKVWLWPSWRWLAVWSSVQVRNQQRVSDLWKTHFSQTGTVRKLKNDQVLTLCTVRRLGSHLDHTCLGPSHLQQHAQSTQVSVCAVPISTHCLHGFTFPLLRGFSPHWVETCLPSSWTRENVNTKHKAFERQLL